MKPNVIQLQHNPNDLGGHNEKHAMYSLRGHIQPRFTTQTTCWGQDQRVPRLCRGTTNRNQRDYQSRIEW